MPQPDQLLPGAVRRLLPSAVRARRAEAGRVAAERAERETEERERRDRQERRRRRVAERRDAARAADPQIRIIDADGLQGPGREVVAFTARGAGDRNLGLVADVLESAGIDYFVVRGRSRLRRVVGVHESHRAAVLEAMRERHAMSALHALRPAREGRPQVRSAYADGALDARIKRAPVIRFAEPLVSPTGRLLAGLEYGCDVEFWQEGARLTEAADGPERVARLRCQTPPEVRDVSLVAPRPNLVADVLPPSAQQRTTVSIGGRSRPTYEPFAWTLADEVTFPVDVVYTWVDGDDPEHARRRARFSGQAPAGLAANASRYISHDELRYSLRSLHMYAPFVRHVYVVTDAQVPGWLDREARGITVVDHRDIFDDDALPTFNSHAIGTRLHHIAGLSDRYLYLNDDVFLARPVTAETFFHGNGIARVAFSPFQLGVGDLIPGEVAPNSAGKNVRALLAESFGRGITHKFKHAPHPQIREVMLELEQAYPEAVGATTRSRFRSPADVGFAATLHHHYALLTGRAVPADIAMRYVDVGAPDAAERLARLEAGPPVDTFCLNDLDTPEEARAAVQEMMRDFLDSRFPFPSPFERTPAPA
ncbi:stealth family protein [Serinicoccus marinus]|uniref:stealth family protein n=1 Tax=Serinicoccus marinus TaxID=247333 RepID=UPI0024912051|nr:stealth family protein [Serinicoccus marinus]